MAEEIKLDFLNLIYGQNGFANQLFAQHKNIKSTCFGPFNPAYAWAKAHVCCLQPGATFDILLLAVPECERRRFHSDTIENKLARLIDEEIIFYSSYFSFLNS